MPKRKPVTTPSPAPAPAQSTREKSESAARPVEATTLAHCSTQTPETTPKLATNAQTQSHVGLTLRADAYFTNKDTGPLR
jgi:hypothetical protein